MNALATIPAQPQPQSLIEFALSPQAVVQQAALIQQIMKEVMKKGEHYGVIPGTEKKGADGKLLPDDQQKNSLFKSGAEKIAFTFGLSNKLDIIADNLPGGHREYRIMCTIFDRAGNPRAQGIGSASTMESKHRYRGYTGKKCPKCGESCMAPNGKDYGGGWYCKKLGGGCGIVFKSGTPEAKVLDEVQTMRKENQDPADQYNTILKMAKKRAFVDAILTATAASDIFAQDLEDLEDRMEEMKDAEVITPTSEGSVGKADKKEDKQEKKVDETKRETVKDAPSPRILMNREGKALKDALDTLQKDSGTPVMVRLCKLHGADSFPILPDAKIDAMRKDLAELAAKTKDGMPTVEETLSGWERTAQDVA